jgi:hypothetical protein
MTQGHFEYQYDDNVLFTGTVSVVDDSFDHPFGTNKVEPYLEVEDFHVIVYICGVDQDVTRGLTDKVLDTYKEHFLEYAGKQMRESA